LEKSADNFIGSGHSNFLISLDFGLVTSAKKGQWPISNERQVSLEKQSFRDRQEPTHPLRSAKSVLNRDKKGMALVANEL